MRKVLIVGLGGCGKDTLCDVMRTEYSISGISSSHAACEEAVYPFMGEMYSNVSECHADRRNHRHRWSELIADYNKNNPSRLARAIYSNHVIYNGIRRRVEFEAIVEEFDPLVVWLDASRRLPDLTDSTLQLTEDDCQKVIHNNERGQLEWGARWLNVELQDG